MRLILTATTLAMLTLGSAATAGDKGTTVTLDGLKSTTPDNWKAQTIDTKKVGTFRKYQFLVPKADGDKEDAELIVLHLGGGGGANQANIERWQKMFAPPEGKTFDDITKIDKFKVGDVPVVYVDIHGTYLSKFPPFAANPKVTRHDHYRFLGVIFESANGPYYLRLTGPEHTIAASKKGFDEWVKGFK